MNEPKRYRKKPVEIKAIRFTGANQDAVFKFCHDAFVAGGPNGSPDRIAVRTIEGIFQCNPGDYIVQIGKSGFCPVMGRIFEKEYDEV